MKKVNTKVIDTLMYTLLVLGTLSLTTCPTTNSKYWEESEKPIEYNANIYTLSKLNRESLYLLTTVQDKYISTEENAYLRLNLYRTLSSKTGSDVTKDTEKYTFDIEDNHCSILKTLSGPFENNALVLKPTKDKPIDENASGSLVIKCDLKDPENNSVLSKDDEGKYKLNLKVNVKEQINDETPFSLKEFYYDKYYEPLNKEEPDPPTPPDIPEGTVVIDENNLGDYKDFRDALISELIKNNSEDLGNYSNFIKDYINSISDEDIKKENALKGLNLEKTEDGKYYYTATDNFAGYAKTYVRNEIAVVGTFYTTGKTEQDINEAFIYYLEEYYCKKNGIVNYDEIYMIVNYIKSNTSLLSFTKGYDKATDTYKYPIDGLLMYEEDEIGMSELLKEKIAPGLSTKRRIQVFSNPNFAEEDYDDLEYRKGYFKYAMNHVYGDNAIISQDLLNEILRDSTQDNPNMIYDAVLNDNLDKTVYFARPDKDGNAILIEVTPLTKTVKSLVNGVETDVVRHYNEVSISKVDRTSNTLTINYPNVNINRLAGETTQDYQNRVKQELIAKYTAEDARKVIGEFTTIDESDITLTMNNFTQKVSDAKILINILPTSDPVPDDEPTIEDTPTVDEPVVEKETETQEKIEDSSSEIKEVIEDPLKNQMPVTTEPDDSKKDVIEDVKEETVGAGSDDMPNIKNEDLIEDANKSAEFVIEGQ